MFTMGIFMPLEYHIRQTVRCLNRIIFLRLDDFRFINHSENRFIDYLVTDYIA